jgi:hypothetical protein
VREDFLGFEGYLIDEDGDEGVPDGLARPGEEFWRCGERFEALE